MIDVEQQLRATLHRRSADMVLSPEMPASVRHRVRRRQALSGLAIAVAAMAVVAVSFTAVQLARPGALNLPPIGLPGDGTRLLLVKGGEGEHAWALYATQAGDGIDLRLEQAVGDNPGTGAFTVPRVPIEWAVGSTNGTPPATIIFGAVTKDAVRLRVTPEGGPASDAVFPDISPLEAPYRVFYAIVPRGAPVARLVALDAAGTVLGRESVPTSDGPAFRPNDLVGVSDAYGNTVGYALYHILNEGEGAFGPPGHRQPVADVRTFAGLPLRRVLPAARVWWEARPSPNDGDAAFLAWWAAYPVHHRVPEG